MRRVGTAALVALLVVTAGCAGGPAAGALGGGDGGDGGVAAAGDATGDDGAVSFYVSDRPNDVDDFEHLNVTVTSVAFHLDDPTDEDEEPGTSTATDAGTSTDTGTSTATDAGTPTDAGTSTATDAGTATATDTDAGTSTAVDTGSGNESEREDERGEDEDEREDDEEEREDDEDEREDDDGDGRWVTYDVTATVDLTELRGANATFLAAFDLPAGEYDRVHLTVSDVEGTLTDGESANVKLPSGRLKLTEEFTVENGSDVEFVYDISVHEAGNSGKYILTPVVSESGTDVPIEPVGDGEADRGEGEREDDEDEREDDEDGRERGDERGDERTDRDERGDWRPDDAGVDARALQVTFADPVQRGENVTLVVTDGDDPVANATVATDGGPDGSTSATGEYVVSVPADAEELEVEVEAGDAEAELEWSLDVRADEDDDDDDGDDD